MVFNKSACFAIVMAVFGVGLFMPTHTRAAGAESDVNILRPPTGGIQPRATGDEADTLHLVYFKAKGAK